MCRVAMLSVHGCPLDRLGAREAGGMQLYVRELSRSLGHLGLSVDVYTRLTNPDLPEVVAFGENARVIHLPAGDVAPLDKDIVLRHLPEFVCNVRRFQLREELTYQFVHSHYWLSGWVGSMLQQRWSADQDRPIPHLTTFHTLARLKNESGVGPLESDARVDVERRIVATANGIVVSTDHEKQALVSLYGASGRRVHVVPPGVDHARFQPVDRARARRALGLGDEPVLVSVGRLDPIKGLDTLLRAVALLDDLPNLRLLILGGNGKENGNAEAHRLKALATELGLSDRVDFVGPVEQEDLSLYYGAADACVIPSHYESFGLVAVEALGCGTPVIAARVGGLPTIVREGENGLLVPWRTAAGFANAIQRLLTDDALRTRLSAAAPASVRHFTWESTADTVRDLYHTAAADLLPVPVCLCGR